ncbi:HPP family protein, partial [Streptomyces sp. T-3]|nr:HPP family protein [Streptomyces sp. T-3]
MPRTTTSRTTSARTGRDAPSLAAPSPWYRTKAPPRGPARATLIATGTSICALLILVALGTWWGQTLLIPPLAASMALVAGASATPLGQPRNVVGGQLVAAVTGYAVVLIGGANAWSAAVGG